uniref:RAB11 family interacting protein 2 n=1 Tax=Dromaius novaehollandiae TaxID=8790 RepID=A0A8C4P8I9_DRONO
MLFSENSGLYFPVRFLCYIQCCFSICCSCPCVVEADCNEKHLQTQLLIHIQLHTRLITVCIYSHLLKKIIISSRKHNITCSFSPLRWFNLESKQGKRTKDRGEIKVNIQFMRNNMTASMFDLSMKDKTKSPFAKLKDKMKGRKNDGTFSDTSSAIIPSTRIPDANMEVYSSEVQMISKPKKPFLLGPQRLSSAHSMSDLTGSHVSSEKMKSSAIGYSHLFRRQLESFGSVDEGGSLKSPHRRTLSVDTSKMSQLDSTVDETAFEAQNDPFTNVSASLPQKFATLPRQKNPFEESPATWDQNMSFFSKPVEIKKEIKKEKKEKVSLFERVTGKKDGKRSDKLSNGGSDSSTDLKSPSAFGETPQESFDYDSTNPFLTNFKPTSTLPSSSVSGVHLMHSSQKWAFGLWNQTSECKVAGVKPKPEMCIVWVLSSTPTILCCGFTPTSKLCLLM